MVETTRGVKTDAADQARAVISLDLQQATAFITALTGRPDTIMVWQLADDTLRGVEPRKSLSQVLIGTLAQHAVLLERMNRIGAAIWVQINEGRRGIRNVTGLRAVFVDDDGKSVFPPDIQLPPTITVASSAGSRNRHYYWALQQGAPIERFTPTQKQLIAALDTDKSIHNLDRVMRLPGSHNMKRANIKQGPPEPVILLEAVASRRYTLDEITTAHPLPAGEKEKLISEPQPEIFTDAAIESAGKIARWLGTQGIAFTRLSPVTLRLRCPFNAEHGDKLMVRVQPRGGVWAGCWHDSCGGNANRWPQLKDKIGGWFSDHGFARGDDVEIATRMLKDLSAKLDEPIVNDRSNLWRYVKEKGIWEEITDGEQDTLIVSYAGSPLKEKQKLTISGGTLKGVRTCALALSGSTSHFAEGPPGLLFSNGFLGVTPVGAAFQPHAPEHRQTVGLEFPFDSSTLPARWFRFLWSCFEGDADAGDKIKLLQEFLGACLCGIATRYQKCLMLHGEGANGKSVFTKVAYAMCPPQMRAAVKPQDFGNEYALARLAGVRVNIVSETPETDILNSDEFKGVITGDPIEARNPYGRKFEMISEAGHIFSCNRLPATSDHSKGFRRRFHVVQWNRTFEGANANPYLAEQLVSEAPAIASWAAKGAERLLAQGGYTVPASDAPAQEAWQRETDPVALFLVDCTEADRAGQGTPASVLYDAFRAWLDRNGHRVMSSTAFGRRLGSLGVHSHKSSAKYYPMRLTVAPPIDFG